MALGEPAPSSAYICSSCPSHSGAWARSGPRRVFFRVLGRDWRDPLGPPRPNRRPHKIRTGLHHLTPSLARLASKRKAHRWPSAEHRASVGPRAAKRLALVSTRSVEPPALVTERGGPCYRGNPGMLDDPRRDQTPLDNRGSPYLPKNNRKAHSSGGYKNEQEVGSDDQDPRRYAVCS